MITREEEQKVSHGVYVSLSIELTVNEEVYQYIFNQEIHHKKRPFREEYLEFLKLFEVDYKEQYLFEFFE